jgi:S-DNA-T family DNA segregation ATPase FtsK/SpoIIIE
VRRIELPGAGTRAGALRGDHATSLLVPPVRLTLGAVLAVNAGRVAARLLAQAWRHPGTSSSVAVLVCSWIVLEPIRLLGVVLLAVLALVGWRLAHAASFARLLRDPVLARWRGWWRYRRHWQPVMAVNGLTATHRGEEYVPRRITTTDFVDSLLVDLLTGQDPSDYVGRADALAHTFGVLAVRVRVDRPGRVWLDLTTAEPLAATVRALPVPERVDLAALPLGVAEDGSLWRLRLVGTHVLIAGATGAGKGSVLWSLIRALLPAIGQGVVQVWAVDPKGGMELAPGAPLCARLAYRTTDDMLLLLEDAVTAMRERQARLLGVTRLHTPTPGDPLIVVVVDELAALTAYADRDTKRKAADLLSLLLSQGRAVGVLVVAALQDPGKDVLPFRDLFPTRIALRLVEDVQIDMVLGRGARDRGARCDQIPPSLPGVGYVEVEGRREPLRVRAALVTDADLRAMCADRLEAAAVGLGGVGGAA